MDEAIAPLHARHRHLGVGRRATAAASPTSCSACAGDVPTLETLAAAAILRAALPDLRVRVVNVVDLMRLQPESEHPHGLSDREFDALFTTDRPVIFAYHGYPWLIHRLTYRRTNHDNIHVRGYKEEGTTTTPFDMVMLNDLDRFHLVMDVIDRVPGLGEPRASPAPGDGRRAPAARAYTREHGEDPPEMRDWTLARRTRPDAGRTTVRVLVVNAGSSSLKLALLGDATRSLAGASCRARARADASELRERAARRPGRGRRGRAPHRPRRRALHHAGADRRQASSATSRELTDLAPLHQPQSLAALDAVARRPARTLPAVACFDTAFHATLPAAAAHLRAAGARGASAGRCAASASTASRTPGWRGAHRRAAGRARPGAADRQLPPRRRRVAVRDRRRPLGRHDDGLHAARGAGHGDPLGSVDPGLLLWLARARAACRRPSSPTPSSTDPACSGWPARADMREVLDRARAGEASAALALDVYVHRLRGGIAAMTAALGGLDVLVFTGGVGRALARSAGDAAAGLGFLGVGARCRAQRAGRRRCRRSAPRRAACARS